MLKLRIIGCVPVRSGIAVQSINFNKYLPIGRPEIVVEFLSQWGIDEIVVLNIDRDAEDAGPDFELIRRVSAKSFVPITAGGKIRSVEHVRGLLMAGADKVCINTAAFRNISLVKEASAVFGNQCIVVSIDVKKINGMYEVFVDKGRHSTGTNVFEYMQKAVEAGAGEIFLNSIDKDGSRAGFDIDLYKQACQDVDVPVIACGGAGHPDHFLECINKAKATSIAAGNFFNYTEHSVVALKAYLASKNIKDVRFDTFARYDDFQFDSAGRVDKLEDNRLVELKYIPVEKEVI